MIAIDTSSLVAYLKGEKGPDVDAVDDALAHGQAVLPPVVLSELLSDAKLANSVVAILKQIPMLEVTHGYWARVGQLRARVLSRGNKARLADALIAQSCIDHRVALVTRDGDFRHYTRVGELELLRWH